MEFSKEHEARLLGDILRQHEKALEEALTTAQREEPIVANLRRAIAALMGDMPVDPEKMGIGSGPAIPLFPEDRGESTHPTRKPEYATMTIVAACRVALEKLAPSGSIHVDRIVREIYEPIRDNDVFYRIKRTVVSEMIRGMDKKGMFVREIGKPNTFGLPARIGVTADAGS